MRKSLIVILAILLAVPAVYARKPKEKAGKVTDNVFSDTKYNYDLSLPDGWKFKIGEKDDYFRMIFTQINYEVPADYNDAPDYTKVPRIVFYVDTTSLSVTEFLDSLVSESYRSDQKKEITKEFEILNIGSGSGFTAEELVTREKKNIDIAGERGRMWTGQMKYRNEVATSASSLGAKRVYGGYGGAIVAIKKGNVIVLAHLICEWNYFEGNLAEFIKTIQTLKFK